MFQVNPVNSPNQTGYDAPHGFPFERHCRSILIESLMHLDKDWTTILAFSAISLAYCTKIGFKGF